MIDYNDDDRNNPSNHLFNEFFDFGGDLNQTEHAEIEQEIFNYFNDLRKDFSILNDYARIKSVFRRYNAPLPSSYSSRKLIKIEQLINVPNFNFAQSDNDWEQNEKKLLLQMNQ
ncbi:threonine aspartase 1-like [Sarcoptes scabiei]|nr:threonine aspartase 1-like [Sarcoptes scabiei]